MKPSHERHLRVLSGIDEDILDPTTEQRAKLYEGRTARRPFYRRPWIVTTAAGLVASLLLVLLLPLLFGSRPVYRGMSVSGANEASLSILTEEDGTLTRTQLAERRLGKGNGNTSAEEPDDLNPIGDTYFATPNEDILIYVHIDNPKNYEILSFTLNGVKYSSYMFEEGSTMELLILKVNVGSVEGIKEYTIDAIKYVDGTAIKDVAMKGDRTIKVAVAYDTSVQAKAEVTDAAYDRLTATVTLTDALELTRDAELVAKLYDGEHLLATQTLDRTSMQVHFDGLSPCSSYRLVLSAIYDDLTGDGVGEHTLTDTYVSTRTFVDIQIVAGTDEQAPHAVLTPNDPDYTLVGVATAKDGSLTEVEPSSVPLRLGYTTLEITYLYEGEELTSTLAVYLSPKSSRLYIPRKFFSLTGLIWNQSTMDYRTHNGMDFFPLTEAGTKVYAFLDGTVQKVYLDDIWGWTAEISVIVNETTYIVSYQSLAYKPPVAVGDRVATGDLIGIVGTSASYESSEGSHLHLTVRTPDGTYVDPEPLVYR